MIFRRLRNMFLLLNLIMTSVMMVGAFVAIYVITASDIHRRIENDLMRISGAERRPATGEDQPLPAIAPGDRPAPVPVPGLPQPEPGGLPDPGFRPDRSVSFSLLLDEEGSVVSASSVFEADSDLYNDAAAVALSEPERFAQVRLDGTQWAFVRAITAGGTRVTFIDVTAEQAILTRLIYTFLIVGGVMLVIIFFLSKVFADRAIRPIRDAFDKQRAFIANASHELRTPVAVITSNVDVLLGNPEDRIADHLKWLDYIKRESVRMNKLTNDLLYLATVDHSDETRSHVEVDLSHMVESTVLSMEAVFFESGLTLTHNIAAGLKTRGDAQRLRRVIVVLLENALKYSDEQGTVTVGLKQYHTTIGLEVANPGQGIDPEHLDRIFDRFYRADSARSRDGDSYGLGLAIAREIVRQHRGTISVRSKEGELTTFRVELPSGG